jgi:hypothetical protein
MDIFHQSGRDIKKEIAKWIDVKIYWNFIRVCKEWKSIMYQNFDYTYKYNYPLVWHIAHNNHDEIDRILSLNLRLNLSTDLLRFATFMACFRVVQAVLKFNINLFEMPVYQTPLCMVKNFKTSYFSNGYHRSRSIFYLCIQNNHTCMSDNRVNILKILLEYDPDLLIKINDIEYIINYASDELYELIFQYIGQVKNEKNLNCLMKLSQLFYMNSARGAGFRNFRIQEHRVLEHHLRRLNLI